MPEPGNQSRPSPVFDESHSDNCDVVIRPLSESDEASFRRACAAFAESDFVFGLGYEDDMLWARYLQHVCDSAEGRNLRAEYVPATFWVAACRGQILGRVSIRHKLNDHLRRIGGHIGYAVVPGHRRRDIATSLLRRGLQHAGKVGVVEALVTCDESNVGSATVIKACGGAFQKAVTLPSGQVIQHYRIPTTTGITETTGSSAPVNETEQICPFCSRGNECNVECQASCWCRGVTVPAALSELVPEHLRRKACICLGCITAYNANSNAFRKAL